MKVKISPKGDFSKTIEFLDNGSKLPSNQILRRYGQMGVNELKKNTPKDTGLTSESWNYRIEREKHRSKIVWYNTNEHDNVNIAVIIQYGHSTRDGGYIRGIDYINPSIRPVFEAMADSIWKEIKR